MRVYGAVWSSREPHSIQIGDSDPVSVLVWRAPVWGINLSNLVTSVVLYYTGRNKRDIPVVIFINTML